jgi:hypothetical protein
VIGSPVGVLILAVLVRGGPSLGLADSKFKIIKGGLLLLGVTVVIWAERADKAGPALGRHPDTVRHHPLMGRLVQQRTFSGADRAHPTRRSRSALLRGQQTAGYRGLTRTKKAPADAARFNASGPSPPRAASIPRKVTIRCH